MSSHFMLNFHRDNHILMAMHGAWRWFDHLHQIESTIVVDSRLLKIKEWVDKNDPGSILIPFSGVFEQKLVEMDEAEAKKYMEDNKATR